VAGVFAYTADLDLLLPSPMGKLREQQAASAGYSGKPLWQKLGIKPGLRVVLASAPADYWRLCAFDPALLEIAPARAKNVDFMHVFTRTSQELKKVLVSATKALQPDGTLWVSWPKKSSGVATDLTEDTLREMALPLGLVDIKVCAVDATWSGLKFVWRRSVRKTSPNS
jgi:hypothetical protein